MDAERMKALREMDNFYCSMLDLIPPDNFGFEDDIKEKLRLHKHQLVDRKLTTNEKKRLSSSSKQLLSRLDFDQLHTVTDIWNWLDKQQPSNSTLPHVTESASIGQNSENNKTKKRNKVQIVTGDQKREALLAKLQAKLALLRSSRKGDRLTEEQRKEKRKSRDLQRKVNRLQRETKTGSNKTVKRESIGGIADRPIKNEQKTDPPIKNEPKTGRPIRSELAKEQPIENERQQNRPITNEQGHTVYSKFDFAVSGLKNGAPRHKTPQKFEKRKKEFAGKNYKKLLEKVEDKERDFAQLKTSDPEKAVQVEQTEKWQKAMEKTAGVKIKDDKKSLKANLKRKEKQKNRSKDGWQEREKNVQAKMQRRQDKRMENINRRKDDKKKHKIEKAKKRGRFVLPS